jgi:spermidine/putrescine transport system permease protein
MRSKARNSDWLFHLYMVVFLAYMLLPLVIMGGAAFNDTRFPSVYPWVGFTGRWFLDLWNDGRMWVAFGNTIAVAIAVVALSVPLGTAAAILINSLSGTVRSVLYGLMVAPILTPGAVIGISTLLFWNKFSVPAGLHLSVLGQVSYIAAFVMLLVLARLQSFDRALEEAALDLGANEWQVFWRITVPMLLPGIIAAALLCFTVSFDDYVITSLVAGVNSETLPMMIYAMARRGVSPEVNALSVMITVGLGVLILLAGRLEQRRT